MPRYAAIRNGVVVGVLGASAPPTINVPLGTIFVDVTEVPDVQGGEGYDDKTGLFIPPAMKDAATRDKRKKRDV